LKSDRGGGHGRAVQKGRGGRGGKSTLAVGAPLAAIPPPTTKAAMAVKIELLEQRLATMATSNIDHIQEARLPHFMGEMISLIWLV
jgi:hypothetical protein